MSKLEQLLLDVSEKNSYYKDIIEKNAIVEPLDIRMYPILTREQLQKNRYNMFTEGYKSKYFSQQLHRQNSSGSSGVPINVYWDYNEYYTSTLSLWRKRLLYYGIHTYERSVRFTLNAFNVESQEDTVFYLQTAENSLTINISLIHNDEKFRKVIELIEEFNPSWFYIQPFVLGKLIQAYKDFDIRIPSSLRYIESVGEILPIELKNKAQSFFGVPVANMYGSEEMNGIAYECPFHHMHVLEDNVLVECLKEEKISAFGEGEAIITNLCNKAMPLIRYNQGDQIILNKLSKICPCGCSSPVIQVIKGRSMNSIVVDGDVEINSFMLIEIMSEVNNHFGDVIEEYKYIYYKLHNRFVCYIKLTGDKTEWFPNVSVCIKKIFNSKLSHNSNIDFEVTIMEKNVVRSRKYFVLEIEE